MEVIAKCAFGMTIDHLGEDDDPFMKKAKEVFSPRVNRSPLILMPCKFGLFRNKCWIDFNLICDNSTPSQTFSPS